MHFSGIVCDTTCIIETLIQAGQQFHLARKDKVLTLFQLFSSLYNKTLVRITNKLILTEQ